MPSIKSVADIKAALLRPSLTSFYEVSIIELTGEKGGWSQFLKDNLGNRKFEKESLNLACCDAILPGSNLATYDQNNDYTGVTERYVHRRVYDDRIDLSFYVDAETYTAIRFFETWIKYISNESKASSDNYSVKDRQYSYRMRYPDDYVGGLIVTKFERDWGNASKDSRANSKSQLRYNFVGAYPTSITSMPISYESSNLLKCQVSLTYLRYYIDEPNGDPAKNTPQQSGSSLQNQALPTNFDIKNITPSTQAQINAAYGGNYNFGFNPGGVPQQAANSSGNTVSGFTVGANSNIA